MSDVLEDWEKVFKYLLNEKMKRYKRLRDEEERTGVINKEVTRLEDGIADLIVKYFEIKSKIRDGAIVIEDEWDELLKDVVSE